MKNFSQTPRQSYCIPAAVGAERLFVLRETNEQGDRTGDIEILTIPVVAWMVEPKGERMVATPVYLYGEEEPSYTSGIRMSAGGLIKAIDCTGSSIWLTDEQFHHHAKIGLLP